MCAEHRNPISVCVLYPFACGAMTVLIARTLRQHRDSMLPATYKLQRQLIMCLFFEASYWPLATTLATSYIFSVPLPVGFWHCANCRGCCVHRFRVPLTAQRRQRLDCLRMRQLNDDTCLFRRSHYDDLYWSVPPSNTWVDSRRFRRDQQDDEGSTNGTTVCGDGRQEQN